MKKCIVILVLLLAACSHKPVITEEEQPVEAAQPAPQPEIQPEVRSDEWEMVKPDPTPTPAPKVKKAKKPAKYLPPKEDRGS